MLLPLLSFCERLASAIVAPAVCAACEELVPERVAFCAVCAATIEQLPPHESSRAGSLIALGAYGGALGDAIRRLKYREASWIARPLGDLLAARCLEEGCAPDLVVPVPMSRARLLERGYNQASLLTARFARLGFNVEPSALERTRDAASQATLRREARLTNLRGAFRGGPALRGAVVLLVDDVTTTGGTLAACRDAIVEAGGIVGTAAVLAIVEQDDDYVDGGRADSSASISSANPPPRGSAVT